MAVKSLRVEGFKLLAPVALVVVPACLLRPSLHKASSHRFALITTPQKVESGDVSFSVVLRAAAISQRPAASNRSQAAAAYTYATTSAVEHRAPSVKRSSVRALNTATALLPMSTSVKLRVWRARCTGRAERRQTSYGQAQ